MVQQQQKRTWVPCYACSLSFECAFCPFFSSGQKHLSLCSTSSFSVEIYPNIFAFGVLTTLFSFSLLVIYGLLMKRFTGKRGRFKGQEAET